MPTDVQSPSPQPDGDQPRRRPKRNTLRVREARKYLQKKGISPTIRRLCKLLRMSPDKVCKCVRKIRRSEVDQSKRGRAKNRMPASEFYEKVFLLLMGILNEKLSKEDLFSRSNELLPYYEILPVYNRLLRDLMTVIIDGLDEDDVEKRTDPDELWDEEKPKMKEPPE